MEEEEEEVMPLVCSVPDHLALHPFKVPSKYLEYFLSYGINTEICEKINIKKYISSKNAFSPKNWKPTETNMASHVSRDPEETMCEI